MNINIGSTLIFLIHAVLSFNYVKGLRCEGIVGGYVVENNIFTFQALLYGKDLTDDRNITRPISGGTIIDSHIILAAAHTFLNEHGFINLFYTVAVGTINLNVNEGIIIDVDKIYVPRTFNPATLRNDIAVLKLRQNIPLGTNSHISKLELPIIEDLFENREGTISGFGFHEVERNSDEVSQNELPAVVGGYFDKQLRYLYVRVVSNKLCKHRSGDHISRKQICSITLPDVLGQKWGPCVGDTGGPLVVDNKVVGILSNILRNCVDTYIPSKYTRVSSFVEFIRNVIFNRPQPALRYLNPYPIVEAESSDTA